MAFRHARHTFISLDGSDLSPFTNTSELGRVADSHDVTTYGKDSRVYSGGLLNGTASMSGTYDDTVTGPRDVIRPLIGTVVPLVRRPEGTGPGLPQDTVQVLITKYNETNPVADMIAWSCEMQLSDDVTSIDQI